MAAPAVSKDEELRRKEDEIRRREEEIAKREAALRGRVGPVTPREVKKPATSGDIIYIGIDFGTSRFSLSTSTGIKRMIPTVVGWPKDEVARDFLRKDVIFGEEAIRNRLALVLHAPMEKGIIEGKAGRNVEAARELMNHMIAPLKIEEKQIFCVIGVPAQASVTNKQVMIDVSKGIADAVMITSQPFMVAYGANRLNNVLIVDIGAGTIDMSRIHGTMPTEDDQRTISTGGNYIDEQLVKLVASKYKGAQITKEMAKKWKEQFGTVRAPKRPIHVQFPVGGVPSIYDITGEIVEACNAIVPETAVGIKELISTFDPEFQDELRRNVILSGGGSQLQGLGRVLEDELEDIGVYPVTVVSDPLYCGADGALKLAKDTPMRYWEELMLA